MSQGLLSYYLCRLAGALLPFLPSAIGYRLAMLVGDILYLVLSRSRENIIDNLRHVLGPQAEIKTLRAIARQIFRNSVKNYYELFHHRFTSDGALRRALKVHGLEHVAAALALGRGLILVSLHMGSPDALLQIAPLLGFPITGPVEPLQPPQLFDYLCRLRQRRGIHIVPVDGPLISLVRAIKRNEVLALAMDRDVTESGPLVDFFGAPARLAHGAVQLALRTGAALCVAYGLRNPDNTFSAVIEPPMGMEITGERERDVRANMQKVVAVLERVIRAHPEQWLMYQPLWKEGRELQKAAEDATMKTAGVNPSETQTVER